jgi:hypothetical protein
VEQRLTAIAAIARFVLPTDPVSVEAVTESYATGDYEKHSITSSIDTGSAGATGRVLFI